MPEDPRWPASTRELGYGMRSPEMGSLYAARNQRRADELIAAYQAAVEHRAVSGTADSEYVRPFLRMLYGIDWDVDDDYFSADLAGELVYDLPRHCQCAEMERAPAILAELRAFWEFAERTAALPRAAEWRAILARPDVLQAIALGIDECRLGRRTARCRQGRGATAGNSDQRKRARAGRKRARAGRKRARSRR